MQETFGVLVLGHGSKLTFNKDTVETVAAMLAKKLDGAPVKTAYLNLDTPTVEEGLKSFTTLDIDKLYVLPLFLAHGTHTLKDIPEILGLKDGHKTTTYALGNKEIEVIYTEPLGVDQCIADLAFKRLKEA
ncbi:MAG: sirohydrochlorin nickelochelatase [Halobacteriota archaeon]